MTTVGGRRRGCEEVDDDELLSSLSLEELAELESELLYLDDNIPTGLRQRDHTHRPATGHFDRDALRRFCQEDIQREVQETKMEDKVGQGEDHPDKSRVERMTETTIAPYKTLENDKKVFQKKKSVQNVSVRNDTKRDETEKTDECKKTTQTRTNCPQKNCVSKCPPSSTKSTDIIEQNVNATSEKESENPVVIDKTLDQILCDDPTLTEVNLNNIEDISKETLLRFAEALCTNTHVRVFSLANTHADDRVAFAVSKMLCENGSVRNLNIESNFVSGRGVVALMEALKYNGTLVELRFHNQRHICGGKVEMEMVQLLRENTTLLKLGYQFDLPGPRMAATGILTRNQDQQRQRRLREKKEQSPAEVSGQTSGSIVEKKLIKKDPSPTEAEKRQPKKPLQSSKSAVNQNRNPPITPTPSVESPTRKIAEMVKQQEGTNVTVTNFKSQSNQIRKPKSKRLKNGANEKESADILKDLRNSLKPSNSQRKRAEPGRPLPPPHRNTRDDLMEAIRGASIGALKRVDPSEA